MANCHCKKEPLSSSSGKHSLSLTPGWHRCQRALPPKGNFFDIPKNLSPFCLLIKDTYSLIKLLPLPNRMELYSSAGMLTQTKGFGSANTAQEGSLENLLSLSSIKDCFSTVPLSRHCSLSTVTCSPFFAYFGPPQAAPKFHLPQSLTLENALPVTVCSTPFFNAPSCILYRTGDGGHVQKHYVLLLLLSMTRKSRHFSFTLCCCHGMKSRDKKRVFLAHFFSSSGRERERKKGEKKRNPLSCVLVKVLPTPAEI